MIMTLQNLLAHSHCSTKDDAGRWVRSMHLPFEGGLFDRMRDAWAVLKGQTVFAVRWPESGELEKILHERCETIVPELKTVEHVMQRAHELGLHTKEYCEQCEHCFRQSFNQYFNCCMRILIAVQQTDKLSEMKEFLAKLADNGRNHMMFHEHPAYMMADFLDVDHESEDFKTILAATTIEKGCLKGDG